MKRIRAEDVSTKHIGHLGLVADKMDELGLIKLVDERLPISEAHGAKVTHGERVAAMILNGLGFMDSRLYMFPEFLADKSVDRLFEREMNVHCFNDDATGRCLDEIAAYGSTKFITELAFKIGREKNLLGKSVNIDTTTLSLYGDYEASDRKGTDIPVPAQGYAKSGRHDLKQMVLLLATTGAANFPIWMQSHSGNASDQKTMPKAAVDMHEFCQGLADAPKFTYVGDSAFYSNILEHSDQFPWISRVSERLSAARKLTELEDVEVRWQALDHGYRCAEFDSDYGNVTQRWFMYFSQEAFERETKTLDKNIEKENLEQQKTWWHLSNKLFDCEADCLKAIDEAKKKMKYHRITAAAEAILKHEGAGRPKKDAKKAVAGYQVVYSLSQDQEKCKKIRHKKGRFILASNDMALSALEILKEYKAQSGTEGGFKFIKNDAFQVDSVFLKTATRIDALMAIMTLCLMIYGVSQYDLREALAENNESVRSQTGKQTQTPTMQWIYFLFRVVNEVNIEMGEQVTRIISNVTDELKQIVKHFGNKARAIYLNTA